MNRLPIQELKQAMLAAIAEYAEAHTTNTPCRVDVVAAIDAMCDHVELSMQSMLTLQAVDAEVAAWIANGAGGRPTKVMLRIADHLQQLNKLYVGQEPQPSNVAPQLLTCSEAE